MTSDSREGSDGEAVTGSGGSGGDGMRDAVQLISVVILLPVVMAALIAGSMYLFSLLSGEGYWWEYAITGLVLLLAWLGLWGAY